MDQNAYNERLKRQADKRRDKVRRMKASGNTWQQIAEALKISRQRAWQLGR